MSRWPTAPLRNLVEAARYGTSRKAKHEPPGLPVIRMGNVTYEGGLDLRDLKYVELDGREAAEQALEAGDLLFNRTNSKELVGKTGLWDGSMPAVAASYFIRLRTNRARAEPAFVWAVMNSALMKRRLFDTARGAIGQANINTRELLALDIPLPPLDEQRRLVDLLNRAAGIRRLRAEALSKARAVAPSLFVSLFGDLASGPDRHPVRELEAVADIGSGITKGRRHNGEPTVDAPYLRVANVQDGRLDLAEIKTIPATAREVERYALRPGDLLLTEGGDPDKLGRGAVWSGEIPGCLHQNHVFRVRPDPAAVLPDYLASVVGSPYGKAYFLKVAKRTTGIASINRTQLGTFPVPVARIEEQRRFAERLANLRSIVAQAERALAVARETERSLVARLLG